MDPKPEQPPAPPSDRTGAAGPARAAVPTDPDEWPVPSSRAQDSPREEPDDDRRLQGEPIGAYLAAQRRLRGISVEELAAQTRIPLRSLERLEAGSFDSQVDGFVRGFVRAVAEALGLDPEESVARTRPEPGDDPGVGPGQHLSLRRVFLTVALVALLGLLLGLVQTIAISPPRGAVPALDPVVIRRDPVAALAQAQAVAGLSPLASRLRLAPRPRSVAAEEYAPPPEVVRSLPDSELSRPVAR